MRFTGQSPQSSAICSSMLAIPLEADWEIEIGGVAPVIDPNWAGFVDLRANPELAPHLLETADVPALADALIRLNASSSPVWTSKCDVWLPESFDPDELDAPGRADSFSVACYIDLLPADSHEGFSQESAIRWCLRVCSPLHSTVLRSCRADLILRRAVFAPQASRNCLNIGVTVYLTACGPTRVAAFATLSSALVVVGDSILRMDVTETAAAKLQ